LAIIVLTSFKISFSLWIYENGLYFMLLEKLTVLKNLMS
jgi:hypothetical protein